MSVQAVSAQLEAKRICSFKRAVDCHVAKQGNAESIGTPFSGGKDASPNEDQCSTSIGRRNKGGMLDKVRL
ncbi:hypothetical protein GCM10009617_36480 [Leifsonia poae]|uniref:Uncharacterized protein n=1 Tax=Leifsonia poae TaxID=110933 RepID=A0A9W6HB18_9MICO|nr:hypothetical protein GCM10017584_21270 [Leifsonia poae]